jgi:hypothetical protein
MDKTKMRTTSIPLAEKRTNSIQAERMDKIDPEVLKASKA